MNQIYKTEENNHFKKFDSKIDQILNLRQQLTPLEKETSTNINKQNINKKIITTPNKSMNSNNLSKTNVSQFKKNSKDINLSKNMLFSKTNCSNEKDSTRTSSILTKLRDNISISSNAPLTESSVEALLENFIPIDNNFNNEFLLF